MNTLQEVDLGHGHEIRDVAKYNSEMEKGALDKTFFLEQVQGVEQVVDYGCANGAVLSLIKRIDPELDVIGYDIDPEMISLCKGKGIQATDNYNQIQNKENSVLSLSSIIHEIYSYCDSREISEFWDRVFEDGYKYIAIRDMMMSDADFNKEPDLDDCEKVVEWCEDNAMIDQLAEFESNHGEITDKQGNLIHFLLKYTYRENWDREVREDYLPITLEEFLKHIPRGEYQIIYKSHNVLPFKVTSVRKDMGVTISDNTHVKILIERIN